MIVFSVSRIFFLEKWLGRIFTINIMHLSQSNTDKIDYLHSFWTFVFLFGSHHQSTMSLLLNQPVSVSEYGCFPTPTGNCIDQAAVSVGSAVAGMRNWDIILIQFANELPVRNGSTNDNNVFLFQHYGIFSENS